MRVLESTNSKTFWKLDRAIYTIWLKVRANSSRPGFQGVLDGDQPRLVWGVSVAPEKGKANRELVHSLAKVLGLPGSAIEIVSGETSNLKMIKIDPSAMDAPLSLPDKLNNC